MRAGDLAEVPYVLATRRLMQAMDFTLLQRVTIISLALETKEMLAQSDAPMVKLDDEYYDALAHVDALVVRFRNCTHVSQYASDTFDDLHFGLPADVSQTWLTKQTAKYQNAIDMHAKDMEEYEKIFIELKMINAEINLLISHSIEIACYSTKQSRLL